MVVGEGARAGQSLVSVVIVNYNAGHLLLECVRAILPQVSEVLVIDNASDDSSLDLCLQQFPEEAKLRIFHNDVNLGFAAACNIGANLAMGDCVLFLNPDCRPEAAAVFEMVRVLESESSIGMVGGLLINPDGSEQGGGRRAVPTPWRSFVRAFGMARFSDRWPKLFYDFYLHKQPLPDNPIEVEAISGACMLVKREAMTDVGQWDEGYFLHCEDLDWCMRFRLKAWKVMFVPSARVVHEHGGCSRTRPIFVEWHKHKGMIRFYRKFFCHQYPGVLLKIVAVGVWLRFGLVVAYCTGKRVWRALGLGRG